MSRICWMVAALMAVGVVGCAQCDTCDDFPAPCTGPNCGQGPGGAPYSGGLGYLDQGPGTMLSAAPGESAPANPEMAAAPMPPADAAPATSPMPTETAPR